MFYMFFNRKSGFWNNAIDVDSQ